jgi:branched-chain amino acid transport system ATP-binding protein
MSTLLAVEALESGYGDVQVLWGLDLTVEAGSITCIVGSNGAGKTTFLRTLSGLVKTKSGSVRFAGADVTGVEPDAALAAGIVHVPEGRRLFKGLTVQDNLLLGAYTRHDDGIMSDLEFVYATFPILKERRKQDATTLSGGEQQMCAIGRGIMSRPKLLLIDELSLGLAPKAVDRLSAALVDINAGGITILLVEQDVMTAFDLAATAFVVDMGRVVKFGATADLADDPAIREAYMGL